MDATQGALAGIRVLEISQFEVATVCGQALAWLGADVIKIEEPRRGEQARNVSTPYFFAGLNSSKRGVTLDLKSARGREILLELVVEADVVIENLAPGTLERLQLDYDELSVRNPGIVLARAKGFGTYGPYSSFKGFDMTAQASGGVMAASGLPELPMLTRFPFADNATGIHMAFGIMAALWQRQATGRGQKIEVALHDSVVSMGRTWLSQIMAGRVPTRDGDNTGFRPANGTYECSEGGPEGRIYVYCHPPNQGMWDALFGVIGRDDLVGEVRMSTDPAFRRELAEELDADIERWTRGRTKQEAMLELGAAGVPCGALLGGAEVVSDPHLNAREMIVATPHPLDDGMRVIGCPIKLSESPPRVSAAPLELGEHNAEVYGALLGLGEAELEALRADGVI
jgi:formyl-CoA transferase